MSEQEETLRMDLTGTIEAIAKQQGIAYFGVAGLSVARDFILEQGGPRVAEFPISISLGITLPKAIVDQLPARSERAVALNYRHHAYDVINQRLDSMASLISLLIQDKGYKALPIPASVTVDDERLYGSFSHKLGAHLAGLGWIGKSCLLITPKHGPRARWATVLTDAPLSRADVNPPAEQCGNCRECVDICPVRAFTGRPFSREEPREARYDVKKCNAYFKTMGDRGKQRVCGMCLYVCPYGR